MTPTGATLFTGGGGVDCGMLAAGITPVYGLEYDPTIAFMAWINGFPVTVADILDIDPASVPTVDFLHASPPCPNFSVAKRDARELPRDIAMARQIAAIVTTTRPAVFTLENVTAYAKSESFQIIVTALAAAGYMLRWQNINAADFGVPQTRRRLWLRAVREGLLPELPAPEPWVGWYAALEDLLPDLPESQFADWQLRRLPEEFASFIIGSGNTNKTVIDSTSRDADMPFYSVSPSSDHARAFLVGAGGYDGKIVTAQEDKPSFTVTANTNQSHQIRAFLVSDQSGNAGEGLQICGESDPAKTVRAGGGSPRAFLIPGGNASSFTVRHDDEPARAVGDTARVGNIARAWLDSGRVVQLTPRCLARLQTFPDWYALPDNKALACKIVGNAVPALLYAKLARQLLALLP